MTKLSLSSVTPVPKAKSKASQLAELLPEIEAALAAGHAHRVIYEDIKISAGLDITFGYYETTIHRLRQRSRVVTQTQTQTKEATKQVQNPAPFAKGVTMPTRINRPSIGSRIQEILHGPVDDFFT
jgi:crotonobetainyl-CoA:carnitine CoA-transferase CaiB-like acyl-CoA transferase